MGLDLGSQGYSNASAAAGENQIENAYYDSFRAGFSKHTNRLNQSFSLILKPSLRVLSFSFSTVSAKPLR